MSRESDLLIFMSSPEPLSRNLLLPTSPSRHVSPSLHSRCGYSQWPCLHNRILGINLWEDGLFAWIYRREKSRPQHSDFPSSADAGINPKERKKRKENEQRIDLHCTKQIDSGCCSTTILCLSSCISPFFSLSAWSLLFWGVPTAEHSVPIIIFLCFRFCKLMIPRSSVSLCRFILVYES